MRTFLLLALLSATTSAYAKSNVITGFHYATCTREECVEIRAPQAHMSSFQGGFSTTGVTELHLKDPTGKVKTSHVGTSASFNPRLQAITLEQDGGGFILHSLRDGKTNVFAGVPQAKGGRP
jgi:hypothetical protein